MRAKITHDGFTVELDDATAEDVERVLAAIANRDIKPAFAPIKEFAPVTSPPFINPLIGDPLPRYPWPSTTFPWHEAHRFTWTVTSDTEVRS